MCKAFGIVNFEGRNVKVKGLQDYRPVGAFSFLGRYRMIDFPISNMSNSGIDHIEVFIRDKARSLIEHLGTGRNYNMNTKRGKLRILPAENGKENDFYNHDIACYIQNMQAIEEANYPYVILAPSHMIYRTDYTQILEKHIQSGADITMLYQNVDNAKDRFRNCDMLMLNKQKGVLSIERNKGNAKIRNISLETYVLSKQLFVDIIQKASRTSSLYWFRDMVNEMCEELDIRGIAHRGYLACINDFHSYYHANMELIHYPLAKELFVEGWPIYTRTNDSAPTYYSQDSNVTNSIISNGCLIEGTIINSVIGRGCVIKKGAVIENSIISPGVIVGEDVHIAYVVVDKKAKIHRVKELCGDEQNPLYVKRGDYI